MKKTYKATWLHSFPTSTEKVKEVVRRLADSGFDILVPCVKQVTGIADYQSKVANVREEFKSWDPLMTAAEEARDLGLDIHAWCCVFPEGEHSALLDKHPEYEVQSGKELARGEKQFRVACPNRPEVQNYEASLYQELIDNYPIAGVSLDYIRFVPGTCFCDYCREDYRQKTGEDLMNLKCFKWNIPDASDMDVWIDWRCNIINRFVERIREATRKGGKRLSASVFHHYPFGLQEIGQDWAKWVDEEWVDYIWPMNYSASTLIASKWATNNLAALANAPKSVHHWQGINRPPAMSTKRFIDHLKAVLDTGVEGFTIFEYPALTDEDMKELKKL